MVGYDMFLYGLGFITAWSAERSREEINSMAAIRTNKAITTKSRPELIKDLLEKGDKPAKILLYTDDILKTPIEELTPAATLVCNNVAVHGDYLTITNIFPDEDTAGADEPVRFAYFVNGDGDVMFIHPVIACEEVYDKDGKLWINATVRLIFLGSGFITLVVSRVVVPNKFAVEEKGSDDDQK